MNTLHSVFRASRLACLISLLGVSPVAVAEIVFLASGGVASVDAAYNYPHPSMRSLVFESQQARDMAVLPSAPYFLSAPPLLLRAPVPYVAYPPVIYQSGLNAAPHPSNRDIATYNLGRAHLYSQGLYSPANGESDKARVLYAWPYSVNPYYPPVSGSGGVNQPIRPSNRDNTTYNLERAHRFSMDTYKSSK